MDVRQISADLFARATAVAGASNETTPAAITPEIIAFCDSLKANPPVYLPVQKDRNGMYGFCNIGVLEKIKVDGGAIRFGWIIWEYPRAYLMAEFHAVWVSATGELIDITPKPDGETRIVFVGDTSYPAEFDFLKRPNNRRMRTYQATHRPGVAPAEISPPTESERRRPDIEAELEALLAEMQSVGKKRRAEIARRIAEIRGQIGGEPTAKAVIDPLPDLIDAFIRAADEQESLMIPVAIGITRCTNTRRAMDLDRVKQHYLSEIRRLLRRA